MMFFLDEFKPYFLLSNLQSKVIMYILIETYDNNLFNTITESDMLYFNTWFIVTREYEFIPIWFDRLPLRRIVIYYFLRVMYLIYGTMDASNSLVVEDIGQITIDSSTIENSLYLNLSDKFFFVNSFLFLFCSIFFYLLKGRTGFMKFLFALEILILICVLGFTLYHSGVCFLAGQFNLALCLIAVAACESVLGLALFIIRKRLQFISLQDKFLNYFTFKNIIQ